MGRKHVSRTTRSFGERDERSTQKVSMDLRREPSKICIGILSLCATRYTFFRSLVDSFQTLRSIPKRSLRYVPLLGGEQTQHRPRNIEENKVSTISPTRGTLEIFLFVCMDLFVFIYIIRLYGFHDANTKYEIVTAGLSVYGLAQAPRLHFSLHVVSIVIFLV